jgi:hypothetical protein
MISANTGNHIDRLAANLHGAGDGVDHPDFLF